MAHNEAVVPKAQLLFHFLQSFSNDRLWTSSTCTSVC